MIIGREKSIEFLKQTPEEELMEGWQSGQMQRTVNPSTFVYDGSNPSPSTTKISLKGFLITILSRGCSSMVEQKPSKLTTGVRFPSPAPILLILKRL